MPSGGIEVRRATPADADALAAAHIDSIRSIGPSYYPANVVDDWAEGLVADVYLNAMKNGEVFFVAIGTIDGAPAVLGFASDYRAEGARHGTSVYVRGSAARSGLGTALLRQAEAHAAANDATSIEVEASLAGELFYRANGFVEPVADRRI